MAPSQHMRGLFRVSAIVPDKILHTILMLFADHKAANVEVHPVAPGPPARSNGTGKAGRPPKLRDEVLALFKPGETVAVRDTLAVLGDRTGVHQTFANLAKDGALERITPGIYRMPAGAPSGAAPGTAAPGGGKPPRKGGTTDHMRSVFESTPDHKLTRQQMIEAIVAFGGSARSLEGIVQRLKLKKLGAGVYQMRSAAK